MPIDYWGQRPEKKKTLRNKLLKQFNIKLTLFAITNSKSTGHTLSEKQQDQLVLPFENRVKKERT